MFVSSESIHSISYNAIQYSKDTVTFQYCSRFSWVLGSFYDINALNQCIGIFISLSDYGILSTGLLNGRFVL